MTVSTVTVTDRPERQVRRPRVPRLTLVALGIGAAYLGVLASSGFLVGAAIAVALPNAFMYRFERTQTPPAAPRWNPTGRRAIDGGIAVSLRSLFAISNKRNIEQG